MEQPNASEAKSIVVESYANEFALENESDCERLPSLFIHIDSSRGGEKRSAESDAPLQIAKRKKLTIITSNDEMKL